MPALFVMAYFTTLLDICNRFRMYKINIENIFELKRWIMGWQVQSRRPEEVILKLKSNNPNRDGLYKLPAFLNGPGLY
jgi:hypothetical protein